MRYTSLQKCPVPIGDVQVTHRVREPEIENGTRRACRRHLDEVEDQMQVSNARHPPAISVAAERPVGTSKNSGQSFSGLIDGASRARVPDRPVGTAAISQGEKLTQFLLTQSVQAMLPKEESKSGSGFAGDVWRGMLAETLSQTLAHAIGSLVPEPGGASAAEAASVREVTE